MMGVVEWSKVESQTTMSTTAALAPSNTSSRPLRSALYLTMAKKAVKKSQSEPSSSTAAVSSRSYPSSRPPSRSHPPLSLPEPADTTTGDAGASAPVVPKGSSGKAGGDEVIRVNTSSLLELKHALDDAVKDVRSIPSSLIPAC